MQRKEEFSIQPVTPNIPTAVNKCTPFERRNVLSAAVDIATPKEIFEYLVRSATRGRGCSVVGMSAPYATAMKHDADLKAAFLNADILIPDGKGFSWGAHLVGVPCGERIAIPDLCEQLLAEGNMRHWKVFIYGATEDVNAAACANVRARFSKLAEVAGQHGYHQGLAEEDALIERLGREKFNLLIVARPSPDKEKFLARCCPKSGVVGLAAGGYADILAGKTSRAPRIVQALGMEWLYRVMQEPRRLWKRVGLANLSFGISALWKHMTMRPSRPIWGSRLIQGVMICLAIVAAYATSLSVPFHFDDPEYIERNPTIRWRSGEGFSELYEKVKQIKVLENREVWWVSNAICFRLSDDFGVVREDPVNGKISPDVRIFRAWNIGCHLIAALALWRLLRRCFQANGTLMPGRDGRGTPWDLAALGAAAIFAAHPLCTESVTYICGRDNGQGGMFYLLGLYFAALAFDCMGLGKAREMNESASASASILLPIPRWPSWFWPLMAAALCGALAVRTKEVYLTFAGAVALLYLCFYRSTRRTTVSLGFLLGIILTWCAIACGSYARKEGYLGTALMFALFFLAGGYFCGGTGVQRILESGRNVWSHTLTLRFRTFWAFGITIIGLGGSSILLNPYYYERVLSAFKGFQESSYLRSLYSQAYAVPCMFLKGLLPLGLNIDHDFPTLTAFSSTRTQTGAAILLLLFVLGLYGLWKRSLFGFAILLAFLSVLPSNSVIERGDIVSERNFYLVAACGACLIVWLFTSVITGLVRYFTTDPNDALRSASSALSPLIPPSLSESKRSLRVLREAGLWIGVLCVCVAGPFSALTVVRNEEWSSGYKLWSATKELSGNKMRVLYNFGIAARSRKNPAEAIPTFQAEAEAAFRTAITLGEDKTEKGLFRPDEAVEVQCFHLAYANLAGIYLNRYMANGKTGATETINRVDDIFKQGLKCTTYDPDLAYTYAEFLRQMGRSNNAAEILQHSLNLHSWADHLYFPLGLSYLDIGEFERAEKYLGLSTKMRNLNIVSGAFDMPKERMAEYFAFYGLAQLLCNHKTEAKSSLTTAFQYDPQGIFLMLTVTHRTYHHTTARAIQSEDQFLVILSKTRRDLLAVLLESIDEAYLTNSEKRTTVVELLKNSILAELGRREREKIKRAEFGARPDLDKLY